MRAIIAEVRAQKYASTMHQWVSEVVGAAVGVHDRRGEVIAAVSFNASSRRMAECFLDLNDERTMEGLKAALARGRKDGRPKKLTEDVIAAGRAMLAAGDIPVAAISKLGSACQRGLLIGTARLDLSGAVRVRQRYGLGRPNDDYASVVCPTLGQFGMSEKEL